MSGTSTWQPLADIRVIKKRALLYQQLREFMQEREIMEVDTPVLGRFKISDPYIESVKARSSLSQEDYFLQTSPEFCMKRLLAAGSGSIYQITHAFRDEEEGKRHKTEFSMLEWYRIGYDYYQLMDEMAELLELVGVSSPDKMTYADTFEQVLNIDPHVIRPAELGEIAHSQGWQTDASDQHELLDFLFSSVVIPALDTQTPLIIYDYPTCMAALATIKKAEQAVSERFELFINGMEIANGFNELCDREEQRTRFRQDLDKRRALGKDGANPDPYFLAALGAGLPKSAGVAVGLDRLLMILTEQEDINAVSTFSLLNN